jgi:ketosteroid isomerase-like protein
VKAALEAANGRFLDAFKRGDKAGLMANYADDAILMMPNEEAWRGRAGLDKGFGDFLGQVSFKDGSATTTDVMVTRDLAVETGAFAWTLQPRSGAEIRDKGKYLTVWKRQADGTWKIVRDINNTDLPAKM